MARQADGPAGVRNAAVLADGELLREQQTGLIFANRQLIVTCLNPAAATLLGHAESALLGAPLADCAQPLADWAGQVIEANRTLQVAEAELGQARADLSFQPLADGVLIELHPITERLRQRHIAERADHQQAIAQLIQGLVHELRNPLAGVRGAAQLISAQATQEPIRRHAGLIQREVDRISKLIDQFVSGSQADRQPVNIHQVLGECADLVMAEARGRVRMVQDFDPSIPELLGVGDQLHQLFLNLFRNAVQAGAERISTTTRIEHDSPLVDPPARHALRVDIDDNGSGVPADLAERLFLPMVSGRRHGTGFGLAIAQRIARGHGGLIEYHRLDQGSRFRFRLPLEVA